MKTKVKKLLSMALIVLMCLTLIPTIASAATHTWSNATVPTVANGDTVTISGNPSGMLVVPSGATVTIEGTVTGATESITFNINTGAKVTDHHFKWWLGLAPIRGLLLATPKGVVLQASNFLLPLKGLSCTT